MLSKSKNKGLFAKTWQFREFVNSFWTQLGLLDILRISFIEALCPYEQEKRGWRELASAPQGSTAL